MTHKFSVSKIVIHLILLTGVAISLFPFYWLAIMATNTTAQVFAFPPTFTFGDQLWVNITNVFERTDFARAFFNTVFVTVVATTLKLFFDSLAGFTFAKFNFRGKNILFVLLLGTMMIPSQLSLVPQFIVMQQLGWVGTFKALIVPDLAGAFGIFLIRQYAQEAIHDSLLEAGRIDGCSTFRLYWNIALPILVPVLAFLGIVSFMNTWQDYLWPLIILQDPSKFTLMIAVAQLQGLYRSDYALVMAGTLLATLPLIIMFLILSRRFIAGIADGAVKS